MPNPASSDLPAPATYSVDPTLGIVVDDVTGLTWQRDLTADLFDWNEAQDFCDALELAGHQDWRLPSRIELVTLVDFTRYAPAIDESAFPAAHVGESHWTSSAASLGENPDFAWQIDFWGGATGDGDVTTGYRARCVRGEPYTEPSERFTIAGSGSEERVRDTMTGLTWQGHETDGSGVSFTAAQEHCSDVSLDGGGWRVPSMKELQTLIVERTPNAVKLDAAFSLPDTSATLWFWTSSEYAELPDNGWRVNFGYGNAYFTPDTTIARVRCVR